MRLAFLHTAEAHVATFAGLMERAAPAVDAVHRVDATLLADAIERGGMTGDLPARLDRALRDTSESAEAVVCTCSTLGGAAEAAGRRLGLRVMRIDRPMAEQAVALADRILVAACLASTLDPTIELLAEVAAASGRAPLMRTALFADAWPSFLAGDRESYAARIAAGLRATIGDADAVVLAQASMAPAAALCADLRIPVLSSPALGVAGAIARIAQRR